MSEDPAEYVVKKQKSTLKTRSLKLGRLKVRSMAAFDVWWYSVASAIRPDAADDMASHAKTIACLAWNTAIEFNNETTKETTTNDQRH